MQITDIGHAAFRAYDINHTLEFYALLGIHEAFRLHHEDGSLMLIYLHVAGDRFIELFLVGRRPTQISRPVSCTSACSRTISTAWSRRCGVAGSR